MNRAPGVELLRPPPDVERLDGGIAGRVGRQLLWSHRGGFHHDSWVSPSTWMGVNHPNLGWGADAAVERMFGPADAVIADIASMGGGVLRQVGPSDLLLSALVPRGSSTTVPPPDRMAAWVTQTDNGTLDLASFLPSTVSLTVPPFPDLSTYHRFHAFIRTVFACAEAGVQLVPTLFTLGGGSSLNDDQAWQQDVGAFEKPPQHGGTIRPLEAGWHRSYYRGAVPMSGKTSIKQKRYALNLWWETVDASNSSDPEGDVTSMMRKSLGVLAYGLVVADLLELLDEALQVVHGKRLKEVIPYLECGNEFDAFWVTVRKALNKISGFEFGRFHALLAGPIQCKRLGIRFRIGELVSPKDDGGTGVGWTNQLTFLEAAVVEGIEAEYDRWVELADDRDSGTMGLPWNQLAAEYGIAWPPATIPTPDEMVHQAGFHWYRYTDPELAGPEGYRTASSLREHVEEFDARVVYWASAASGLTISTSVSETGFPALYSDKADLYPPYSDETVQATHLVQRLLTLKASGVSMAMWHAFLSAVVNEGEPLTWDLFYTMGVRNDAIANRPDLFDRTADGWPRASWYAYRRLVWLLSRASAVSVFHHNGGALGVRLTASTSFLDPDDLFSSRYSHAYVLWCDGTRSGATQESFVLTSAFSAFAAHQISLVPEVDGPGTSTDANGYPRPDEVEWYWSGWDGGATSGTDTLGRLEVTVPAMDLTTATVVPPVCMLVDEQGPDAPELAPDDFADFPGLADLSFEPPGRGLDVRLDQRPVEAIDAWVRSSVSLTTPHEITWLRPDYTTTERLLPVNVELLSPWWKR